MTLTTLTPDEQAERERAVAAATHSLEMEGLSLPVESQADAEDYVAGRAESAELIARARARYGLD